MPNSNNKKGRIFRQFFALQLLISVGVGAIVALHGWYESYEMSQWQAEDELTLSLELLATILLTDDDYFDADDDEDDDDDEDEDESIAEYRHVADKLIALVQGTTAHWFYAVFSDGTVIGSDETRRVAESELRDIAQLADARENGIGIARRKDSATRRRMLYVAKKYALPEAPGEHVTLIGAMHVRTMLTTFDREDFVLLILLALLLVVTVVLSYLAALRIIGPLSNLHDGLTRIGNGDFATPIEVPKVPHIADLVHTINAAAANLDRLETTRKDFVANVAHELRTPLTAISGFADALLRGARNDPEKTAHFLDIIARHAKRTENLITDLLTLSRLEAGAYSAPNMIAMPVRMILHSAVDACLPLSQEKNARVDIACPDELFATVHPRLMEIAVINLLSNAIRYGTTPERNTVQITASAEGANVVISVTDFGPGIDAAHINRLFERFYRADKGRSRDIGGSGLGLAIVKHILLVHNGTVAVTSAPGNGTTFTMTFPMMQDKSV